jgi:hypothetical protein
MIVMMIVLVALGTIAGLTVISVQGGSAQASAQRFSSMALYAAESGAAVTMDWLKGQQNGTLFTAPLDTALANLPGNGVRPGEAGNLLSNDQQGWYEVTLTNNRADPNVTDTDGIVVIQVTGHGPSGALRRLEWEVRWAPAPTSKLMLVGWRDVF